MNEYEANDAPCKIDDAFEKYVYYVQR